MKARTRRPWWAWQLARHPRRDLPTTKAVKPKPQRGTCRVCGCTDENGCFEGCWWADEQHTLCSSCVRRAA